MDLKTFIQNAKNLNAEDILVEAASLVTEELADQNVENRHNGLLSTGQNIAPNYETDVYSNFKKSIGSKSSPVPDLHVEGNFDEGQFAKVEGKKLIFGSTDEKDNKLKQQYTDKIHGVRDGDLIQITDPEIPRIIDKKLMA